MATTDRNSRKEELLAAARDRLTEEKEARDAGRASAQDSGPEIRYRGKVVRQSGTGGAPGSPSGGRRGSSAGNDEVRAALQKIKDLYREGLISRADAEKKRAEILDRL